MTDQTIINYEVQTFKLEGTTKWRLRHGGITSPEFEDQEQMQQYLASGQWAELISALDVPRYIQLSTPAGSGLPPEAVRKLEDGLNQALHNDPQFQNDRAAATEKVLHSMLHGHHLDP